MPETLEMGVGASAADDLLDRACRCAFCARPGAFRGLEGAPSVCPLCSLPRDLGRPRIDEEARLIWLPEASQSVVNILCREIHVGLYRLLEPLRDDALPGLSTEGSVRLYYARVALTAREDAAASRLGTSRPSELGEALCQLPAPIRARQAELLAGLRLLPRGRFFVDDRDIYPQVVGTWSAAGTQPSHPQDEVRV